MILYCMRVYSDVQTYTSYEINYYYKYYCWFCIPFKQYPKFHKKKCCKDLTKRIQ